MFEVGQFYTVEMMEGSTEGEGITTYPSRKVLEVSMPLVKFENHDGTEVIINTGSLAFVRATKKGNEADALKVWEKLGK